MLRIEISAVHAGSHPAGLSGSDQIREALAAIGYHQHTAGFVAPAVYAESADTADEKDVEIKADTDGKAPGKPRGRPKKDTSPAAIEKAVEAIADKPQISANPENRVEPESVAKAVAELPSPKDAAPTRENLRAAFAAYVSKFGMPAAVADMPKVIGAKIIDVPDAELGIAIAKIEAKLNPVPEAAEPVAEVVETVVETAAPVTREDIKTLVLAYGATYGQAAMEADLPGILGFPKLSAIPEDPAVFATVRDAVRSAIDDNPFGREPI